MPAPTFELYQEIIDFLFKQYGYNYDWLCRRNIVSLYAGQYFLIRDEAGNITTYCSWWLVTDRDIQNPQDMRNSADGTTIWVMDAASTDKMGIRAFQKYLRERYPVQSGVKGIAWLREGKRLVHSPKQQGVSHGW